MTRQQDFRRDPETGVYRRDETALRDALLDLGELVRIHLIRLDTDQGIDTADLVEGLTRWREAVEDIDTARGAPADEADDDGPWTLDTLPDFLHIYGRDDSA